MDEDTPTFKIALAPPLNGKIPAGSPLWPKFNASFENVEIESVNLAARIYDGQPITTWHRDHWRTSANFMLGQHIGIDFDTEDDRSSIRYLLNDPFISRWASMLYTTPSHTPEKPRARAIFLLDTPIYQAANYTAAASALLWIFGTADRQCKDAVRFFYGGRPGACEMQWLDNVLPLERVKDMIRRYQASGAQARRQVAKDFSATPDQAELKAALDRIPAWGIDYDQWLAVLMGIHSAFPGGDGLALAESWAQGTEGEVGRKWKSFKPDGNTGGAVTVATVFKLAMERGYAKH